MQNKERINKFLQFEEQKRIEVQKNFLDKYNKIIFNKYKELVKKNLNCYTVKNLSLHEVEECEKNNNLEFLEKKEIANKLFVEVQSMFSECTLNCKTNLNKEILECYKDCFNVFI